MLKCLNVKMMGKGVSIYLAIMIMFILLAIGLGMSVIIVSQMKMIKGMGDSVIAFYAADTGIEHILYRDKICYKGPCPAYCKSGCQGLDIGYEIDSEGEGIDLNGAKYQAKMFLCYTFQSKGTFSDTSRAIETSRLPYKIVFAASVSNGDLESIGGGMGLNPGVDGADNICNNKAAAANLSGSYMAWITGVDDTTKPDQRFIKAQVSYIRTDCRVVATYWNDLINGSILVPINKDEDGNSIADPSYAFTNTNFDGTQTASGVGVTCNDWTSTSDNAKYGTISQFELDQDWTETGEGVGMCDPVMNYPGDNFYIYCFQQ